MSLEDLFDQVEHITETELDYEATREATEALIEKLVGMDMCMPSVVSAILTTTMIQLIATSPSNQITMAMLSSCLSRACRELSEVDDPRITSQWQMGSDELH